MLGLFHLFTEMLIAYIDEYIPHLTSERTQIDFQHCYNYTNRVFTGYKIIMFAI